MMMMLVNFSMLAGVAAAGTVGVDPAGSAGSCGGGPGWDWTVGGCLRCSKLRWSAWLLLLLFWECC